MQAKSGCVFDGSAHLKNIPTNSSGEGIVSVEFFFFFFSLRMRLSLTKATIACEKLLNHGILQ